MILVQDRCEIRNDSAPDSQGSLRVVAHVAQWIERLPPEQKVVGPIPTVGARNTDRYLRSGLAK